MSTRDLLNQLNETQAAAAQHFTGPALVVAGAGSGKTRTLIYRIAHLIEHHHVAPHQILAVTFTNKAAAEMRERAGHLVSGAENLWMSTFHSAGVRILRTYSNYIGIERNFNIYDDDDQIDLIKRVIESVNTLPKETSVKTIRGFIDRAKNNLQTPSQLLNLGDEYISGIPLETAVHIYQEYERLKKKSGGIDFNDLITETVRLFQEYPAILERVQNRAQFIHIDEYQDTNKAQYEITRLLASRDQNILVVGDPDQSIYAFRGADIQNILDFQKDYPDAMIYRLEHNYRSNAAILKAANELIERNSQRLEKTLKAVKESKDPVYFYRASSGRAEAEFVADWATKLKNDGLSWNDITVLYRTNAQSRQIEEELLKSGIPVKIVGSVNFYDRREVKDILAYTRLALNQNDDVSFRRIIARPRRGIGPTTLDKLVEWAQLQDVSLLAAARMADQIIERGAEPLMKFAELISQLSSAIESQSIGDFLRFVYTQTGYATMLIAEGKEGQARIENLEELFNAADEWSQANHGILADFLDEVALLGSVDKTEETEVEKVTLMTLHNAKGLEFPAVFLVGMEEGLLPSHASIAEGSKAIEEERRLLYVGITRAMQHLFIISADQRFQYGTSRPSKESRFFEELRNNIELIDAYGTKTTSPRSGRSWNPQAVQRPAASLEPTTDPAYKGGEQVLHPKFGKGQVLAVAGTGKQQQLTVFFENGGIKKLIAHLANMQRLS